MSNKEVIYVRIEKELKEKLNKIAIKDNRSLNNLIVTIINKYLKGK